jgi:hypothetical protein
MDHPFFTRSKAKRHKSKTERKIANREKEKESNLKRVESEYLIEREEMKDMTHVGIVIRMHGTIMTLFLIVERTRR